MRIEDFLSRLQKVKKTGPNTWLGCCPGHDDKNPSLSIRYDGGKILVYCFPGCEPEQVVGALGLTMADLYDDAKEGHVTPRKPFPAADILAALQHELLVMTIVCDDILRGEKPSERDVNRIRLVRKRLEEARRLSG